MKKLIILATIFTLPFGEGGAFAQIVNEPGSGNSLLFNGTSDWVKNIGNTSSFSFVQNTGVFSIEAWIKSTNPNSLAPAVICGNTLSSCEKGFFFRFSNAAGGLSKQLEFFAGDGLGNNVIYSLSPVNLINDTLWHHVAVVGNSTAITFYVDGIAYAGTGTMASFATGNADRALSIGANTADSVYAKTEFFNGSIDEMRIWNTTRTQTQVRVFMSSKLTGTESGLVLYYRFDEGSGLTVFDQGINMFDGTASTVTIAISGPGGTLAFSKTFGGTGDEGGNSVIQTSDGGYALIGYTNSYGAGGNDILVIKTDASGVQQWAKTFGGAGDEQGNDIKQTSDGGYILIANTNSFGLGGYDALIIKLDSLGSILWQKTYGTGSNDHGHSAIQTTDGGFAFSGYTNNQRAWGNTWIVKTDAFGIIIWSKILAAASGAFTLTQTTDGGYLLGGNQAWGFGGGWYDSYIEKLDASGTSQWIKGSSDASDDGEVGWAIQTNDGGYLWSGATNSGIIGSYDGYLMKFDGAGAIQWMKATGTTGYDFMGYSVQQLSSGDFISTGYTTDGGMAGNNICIYKNDVNGNYITNEVYGGAGSDTPGSFNSMKSTNDGGIILIGSTNSFGAGGVDIYIIKTDGLFTGSCSAALMSVPVAKNLVNGADNGAPLSTGTSLTTVTNPLPVINNHCGTCQ